MIDYSNVDIIVGIGIGVIGAGSILLGLLSWVGNKMYDKLISLEMLITSHLVTWSDKFALLDNRVSKLEVKIDNMKDICTTHYNNKV